MRRRFNVSVIIDETNRPHQPNHRALWLKLGTVLVVLATVVLRYYLRQ
jgi:hypothetical protein